MDAQERKQQQAIDSVNFILQAVNDYMHKSYKVITFDKTCVNCGEWCEFASNDYSDIDAQFEDEDDIKLDEDDKAYLLYVRQGDKPIFYETRGGKRRVRLCYLVDSKLNFNDARLMQAHGKKLKEGLKGVGVQVNTVSLRGKLCKRGRSLRVFLVITY